VSNPIASSVPPDRLLRVEALLRYAVDNALGIELELIDEAHHAMAALADADSASNRARLDKAVIRITEVTLPVTLDSVSVGGAGGGRSYGRFRRSLLAVGSLLLVALVIVSASFKLGGPLVEFEVAGALLAILLGWLGAALFAFFYVLRIIPEQAFNPSDEFSNYARLFVGGLLGLIVYIGPGRDHIDAVMLSSTNEEYIWLMLPFMVGYSTSLALGILNKLVQAIETIFSIQDDRQRPSKVRHLGREEPPQR
jgi:hypothetical protein